MPSRASAAVLLIALQAASGREPVFHYHVASDDAGSWPRILASAGWMPGQGGIYVLRSAGEAEPWKKRIEQGAIVIVEGESPLAAAFGVEPQVPARPQPVRNVVDVHNVKIPIIWERPVEIPRFQLPAEARVFTRERWHGLPLVAGIRHGEGALVWLAVPPGEKGYERFPYLLQALADLGAAPPLRARRLWAFLDASYRSRVDLDYFARRWREAGIAALHVASWHFFDPDTGRDEWLQKLIEACHRNSILVYAWIELPHVSERFWTEHPEWREKTALGQDAHLDWRRLMNLQNPDCARAAAAGLDALLARFDWDGINLAELYFESLEGHANAARFTPMNENVRRQFRTTHGFDPAELFDASSSRAHSKDAASLRLFLDWRAGLAREMQESWIGEMERIRSKKPHLDLVLTHVDDRYDTRMRDLIGADAARLLPLLDRHDFTFLIEDPATVWHLGPDRYTDIAARYRPLTSRPQKLAIDINIVERYQDVYPTKQQTGVELFQLVQLASRAFPRVALYFEFSILPMDLPLLSASAATPDRIARAGPKLVVESRHALGVPWSGPARVNGQPWPYVDGRMLWLPAGAHSVEPAEKHPSLRILDFSGDLRGVTASAEGIEFSYRSEARAWLRLDRAPTRIDIDGEPAPSSRTALVALPRGQHWVQIQGHSPGR